jgi:hypothetical protein
MIPISLGEELGNLRRAIELAPDSTDPKALLKVFLRAREAHHTAVQWIIVSRKADEDLTRAVRSHLTQALEILTDDNDRRLVMGYLEEFADRDKLVAKYTRASAPA